MTVKELKEALARFPEDYGVLISLESDGKESESISRLDYSSGVLVTGRLTDVLDNEDSKVILSNWEN